MTDELTRLREACQKVIEARRALNNAAQNNNAREFAVSMLAFESFKIIATPELILSLITRLENAEGVVRILEDELIVVRNAYARPSDALADLPRSDYLELYLKEIRDGAKTALEAIRALKTNPTT